MSNADQLNEMIAQLHEKYLEMTVEQQGRVVEAVSGTRLEVVGLLEDYANKNDTISKSRINPLLRDLEQVERSIRTTAERALVDTMSESADAAYVGSDKAFQAVLGSSIEFVWTAKVAESIILSGLKDAAPTPGNLATYLAERLGPDGLTLSDRVWQFAGDQRAAVDSALRRGIIRGDTTSKMIRDIRGAYDNEAWKARRLALTESNTAYRTAIGYVAEQSKFVSALRLIPGYHHSPKCAEVSREDRHGLGAGVFLPSDTDIYNIHPNCTAYTQYILTEEVR